MHPRQNRDHHYPNNQQYDKQASTQSQGPPTSLDPAARCCWYGSNNTIIVLIFNLLSRPRARSWWPEPNDLLALPIQNQTLCCERVPRQETSIVHIFGIGAVELRVVYPSSSAQLPLQSCVDSAGGVFSSGSGPGTFQDHAFV